MSAPRGRQPGEASASRRAALLYLQGGITMRAAGERHGVGHVTVFETVARIRQSAGWPEDECTC